eukprot:c8460_g1_i1.p1 GENE.c8460_g1_i1~~c8460_g1_i1.p1  ORF type:complete len:283 (+),score=61.24 c8460_g1_i1:41-850(+)
MSVAENLARLSGLPSQVDRADETKTFAVTVFTANPFSVSDAKLVIDHLAEAPSVISKSVFEALVEPVRSLQSFDPTSQKVIGHHIIEKLLQRVPLEEQLGQFIDVLSKAYREEQRWIEAAKLLAQLPMESTRYSAGTKADWLVTIAQLYLEADDAVAADAFINRANEFMAECKGNVALEIRYKVCYSRILDSKKKFLEAAQWYYRISQLDTTQGETKIPESELVVALSHSITCAILSPAGPARSRILSMLYKDERSAVLGNKFTLLKNM